MKFQPNTFFFYYLYFIQERMEIFHNKLEGKIPLTADAIMERNKFTNVYRALDRSSQYLISNVIYNERGLANDYDTEDIFWRIILYKHFNLPSTWEALEKEFGDITLDTPNSEIIRFLKEYQVNNHVYSNAYMITAAFMRSEAAKKKYGLVTGMPKFELYLRIFEQDFLEKGIMYKILRQPTFELAFNEIMNVCGIADFLAYQLIQDLNYSALFNFDPNSFCAAGPGTIRGIERTFNIIGKPNYQEIVKWTHLHLEELTKNFSHSMSVNLTPRLIEGLPLTVPDCSNVFCETDKYMRGLGIISEGIEEGRVKQKYTPSNSSIDYVFPPKWGLIKI